MSPYLADDLRVGDAVEMRGPSAATSSGTRPGGPLLLVGGGSGIVPLMSMSRHRRQPHDVPTNLLAPRERCDDLIYPEELERLASAGSTSPIR